MEVRIPELNQILVNQATILKRIEALESWQLPEWIALEQACALKGIDKKTAQNQAWMRPPLEERRRVGGSRDWKYPKNSIFDWLSKTDDQLKAENRARLRVVAS